MQFHFYCTQNDYIAADITLCNIPFLCAIKNDIALSKMPHYYNIIDMIKYYVIIQYILDGNCVYWKTKCIFDSDIT